MSRLIASWLHYSYNKGGSWYRYKRRKLIPSKYDEDLPRLARLFIDTGEKRIKKDGVQRRLILEVLRSDGRRSHFLIDRLVLNTGGKVYHQAFDKANQVYHPADSDRKFEVIGQQILDKEERQFEDAQQEGEE